MMVSQVIALLLTGLCSQTVSKSRYFQVAESQVIVALQWLQSRQWSRESGYFQVAESQVISGLQSSRSVVIVQGNRATSRLRNPRSSLLSLLSTRYFQVADSNAIASQVMVQIPFVRAF